MVSWGATGVLNPAAAIPVIAFMVLAVLELVWPNDKPSDLNRSRMTVNLGLPLINGMLFLLVPVSAISISVYAHAAGIGFFNSIQVPSFVVLLVTVLARTGSAYWVHRASHAVPLLWRFHRVHHSDTSIDLTLGLRHHPVEAVVSLAVVVAVVLALGVPAWAVIIVETLLFVAGLWEHAAISTPRPAMRMFWKIFVTPEAHAIHHSAHQPQTDSNFGVLLLVWDHLFGTYRSPVTEQVARTGLGEAADMRAANLIAQLAGPFRKSETQAQHPAA